MIKQYGFVSARWLWLVAAACGSSKTGGPTGSGASETAMITSMEGGTITVDGTTLAVPPGALPADTEITVTSTTAPPPSGYSTWYSPVFKFDPDGLMFLMPVQVSLEFAGSPSQAIVEWSVPTGGFENLGGTVSGHTITTTVIHFSQGFVADASTLPDAGTHSFQDSGPSSGGGSGFSDSGSPPDGAPAHLDGGTGAFDGGSSGGGSGGGGGSLDAGTLPDGGSAHLDGGTSGNDGGSSGGGGGGSLDAGGGGSADGGTGGGGGGTPDGGTGGGGAIDAGAGGGGGAIDGGAGGGGGGGGSDGGIPVDAGGPTPK